MLKSKTHYPYFEGMGSDDTRTLCGQPVKRGGKIPDLLVQDVTVHCSQAVTCERCEHIYGRNSEKGLYDLPRD